jgi:ankyrin repeat protein
MKYIRMDLEKDRPSSENASEQVVIDFFYSDRGGDVQRGHQWMLRSLLYQLLRTRRAMWHCYRKHFAQFKQRVPQNWELESLKQLFDEIIRSCKLPLTIYVLIDAMDESDESRREEIMALLSGLCDSEEGCVVLKILVASRPVPRIGSALGKYLTITLEEETKKDIICFADERMTDICAELRVHKAKVQKIHHMIVERSHGVFLWVKLVLDELKDMACDGCTLSEMERRLESLPQDLNNLYAHMLEKLEIRRSSPAGTADTLRMLQWVAHSGRPLSLVELSEAVAASGAFNISLDSLESRRAPNLDQARRMVLTRCGHFLEVKTGFVQFIHQTVREFLFSLPATSSFHIHKYESIESIATTCLRYLEFINNETRQREHLDPEAKGSVHQFLKSSLLALLNYAAYAPQSLNLSDPSQQYSPVFGNLESVRREFISLIRRLFQSAIHSDRAVDIDSLLQSGMEIDQEDTDAIRSFLTSKSKHHYCFPACEGYTKIVDWLVETCGWSVGKALQQASFDGHEVGALRLLKYDVSDKDVFESLSRAATKGQWGMVELLHRHGFKENDMCMASYNVLQVAGNNDRKMQPLLHYAASKGYEAILKLCIDHGEDVNSKDDGGRVALHFAVEGGQEAMIRQLLGYRANTEAKTNEGLTALHLASRNGHDATVELLIQHFGADRDSRTNDGSTALHLSSKGGHDSTVQLLIERFSIDKETKTSDGWTALHLASRNGHDSTVELLIQHFHADRDARTNDGSTALHLSSKGGHDSTIQLLIERFSIDKEAKNKDGWTALHYAASQGHDSTALLLIDQFSVNKKTKNRSGKTALHLLVRYLYVSKFLHRCDLSDAWLNLARWLDSIACEFA